MYRQGLQPRRCKLTAIKQRLGLFSMSGRNLSESHRPQAPNTKKARKSGVGARVEPPPEQNPPQPAEPTPDSPTGSPG